MQTARRPQRTIAREAEVRGIGFIHNHDVAVRFLPAEADSGVVFRRTDLPDRPAVRARVANVVPRQRRTALQSGDAVVEMVEHVMAALAGLRVDNCVVEIDAPETPGCDGSSRAFLEALDAAGTVALDRPREVTVIDQPVTVWEGKAALTAHPGDGHGYVLSYHLDYGRASPIGSQSLFIDVSPESFAAELAQSRTFLLEAEAKALRESGVGARTTEADVLVFGPEGLINNTLRYPDECVRHKILDMVGDLALLERDIIGHVVAHRSGHHLNAALVRALQSAGSRRPDAVADRSPASGAAHDDGAAGSILGGGRGFDVGTILDALPHRYPFLLVDRVLEIEPGKRATAVKNVSFNEPFFQGHWPGRPVMPGVLILEALAQAAGLMLAGQVDRSRTLTVIAAIDGVKMRRPVVPGDQLRLEVHCVRLRRGSAQVRGEARVDGRLAAEAKFTFVMVQADRPAA